MSTDQLEWIGWLNAERSARGMEERQARSVRTAPLVGLNQLRIGSAHIGKTDFEESLR